MPATRTPLLVAPWILALTATFAQAQASEPVKVYAVLNGGDIAPEPVLTGAWAAAELTIDAAKGEITVSLDAFNVPTGVSGAHVHVGSPGMVGPVLFDLRPAQRQAGDVTVSGTLSVANLTTSTGLGIRDVGDAFQSMIGLATYIDIHTDGHADGEIRGWLGPWTADYAAAIARRTRLQSTARR